MSTPLAISSIDTPISSLEVVAASELCAASELISEATTAKPRPASPALAASIEALRES